MKDLLFSHPHTLLDQVFKVLKRVGAKNFFKSPNVEVKKAREAYAAYFFTLAMKKYTGKDWWLIQPDQAERSYPDFDFMSFGETLSDIGSESVELTGVYPHFESFDEVVKVVKDKQEKYGPESVKFSLLIFVNHEKSEEWITLLREHLVTEHPFLSIWTIHLRFKRGGQEVGAVVAQRIRPLPGLRITAYTDDPEMHKRQHIPDYMEEKNENGKTYVYFKKEFIDKIKLFRGASK